MGRVVFRQSPPIVKARDVLGQVYLTIVYIGALHVRFRGVHTILQDVSLGVCNIAQPISKT